ncbi:MULTISPECIES: FadR/GntR family transcriptional regulator [unclassified Amycolatopsis]|uniref:FadR/GntR family transcriptional regulator n=1 Tax=unclassified Amycolatopsis TaxID=2618356 RepID=UPI0028768B74|nr:MULTISPECIES: FadR/GntR family transcriptional regulator [unclassified Amycolatopsis]MDS0133987.1 FadR family transcriptional regulator [Amycolatopsis sp. 505]MDS0144863.1 FadR family transcriptional regulator [Amycolatopsis sp. CM201R]
MTEHRPRGLHGQTVEALASRILSDEWGEGTVLDLPALREELDISLTALREALKVLAAKGMIDARQKRGTFVQPREKWNMLDADVMRWQTAAADDPGLLDELTEVRAVVEPAAARIAAGRATEEDLEALRDALADMAAAGDDPEASVQADLAFHRRLMAATHNNFLVRMERIIAIGLAERDKLVHGSPAAEDPVPNHRKVFDAIVAGDPAAAEQAMLALVTKAQDDLAKAQRTRS